MATVATTVEDHLLVLSMDNFLSIDKTSKRVQDLN